MVQYDGAIIINMTAWWAAQKSAHTFIVLLEFNVPLVFDRRPDESESLLLFFISSTHLEMTASLKAL